MAAFLCKAGATSHLSRNRSEIETSINAEMRADWTRVLDALVFIGRMEPSRQASAGSNRER